MNIRSAWNKYKALSAEREQLISQRGAGTEADVDAETVAGLNFGVGVRAPVVCPHANII
jgi:hypothetical protein